MKSWRICVECSQGRKRFDNTNKSHLSFRDCHKLARKAFVTLQSCEHSSVKWKEKLVLMFVRDQNWLGRHLLCHSFVESQISCIYQPIKIRRIKIPTTIYIYICVCVCVCVCAWVFGLVWFYGISTIVGYLIPNPFLSI